MKMASMVADINTNTGVTTIQISPDMVVDLFSWWGTQETTKIARHLIEAIEKAEEEV